MGLDPEMQLGGDTWAPPPPLKPCVPWGRDSTSCEGAVRQGLCKGKPDGGAAKSATGGSKPWCMPRSRSGKEGRIEFWPEETADAKAGLLRALQQLSAARAGDAWKDGEAGS